MNRELRERLLLPFWVPVGSALAIAFFVFSFSRVLLAAPKEVAVAVALMMAVNILVVCALIAAPPFGLRPNVAVLIGVAMFPVILGLAATTEAVEEREGPEVPEGPRVVEIAADGLAFDSEQVTLEAGRPNLIKFNNREAQPHNIAIFGGADASAPKLFTGEVVVGPRQIEYQVPPLGAGSYFFRCDFHPVQMTGTIVAEERAEKPPAAGPFKASIAADKLAFTTTELSFPSGVPVELAFDNREAQPHNVAIFQGADEKGTKVFTGELVTGPGKVVYKILALSEGAFFFRCDFHPVTMKGTIKVG
jgi:plastocyanin